MNTGENDGETREAAIKLHKMVDAAAAGEEEEEDDDDVDDDEGCSRQWTSDESFASSSNCDYNVDTKLPVKLCVVRV